MIDCRLFCLISFLLFPCVSILYEFPISSSMLNGTFFCEMTWFKWLKCRLSKTNYNNNNISKMTTFLISWILSAVFPKGSGTGCDCSLGGGWMIFHFRVFKSFWFLLIEIHYTFSNSCIVLTCYVYCYYCIWLGFKTLFSCFFAWFLLFSPKGSVTVCDTSFGSFY